MPKDIKQSIDLCYYQPAGPLISPHVLPPVAAAPPPPNVPLLPSGGLSKSKQQIPAPLGSDPEQHHLQQASQSASTADSTDSDVLITGGDLTPFRYATQANTTIVGGAGATAHHPATLSQHHQQQQQQQQQQHQQQHQLHQQAAAVAAAAAATAAAAHQGSPYPRSMHAQMHYSTAYPPNYYTPYPSEAMCYSPPVYQPYFPTKVYQSAPPPPPPSAYRRYPYYQPGPPPPPPTDLYEQAPPPPTASGGQQAGPPPTQAPPPPPTGQLVPAGPAAHTQHLEHYPGPPGYYSGYSPGGGAAGQCYTRSIQAPFMEYPPPQCPCPMQQSCPKNVHTGPHIGSNSGSSINNNSSLTNSGSSSNNSNNNISNNTNNNNTIMNHSSSNSNNNNNSSSNNNVVMNGNSSTNSSSSSNNKTKSSTTLTMNNNSSLTALNVSQNSSSNLHSNSNNNVLTTSRGPVKNHHQASQQHQQQQQLQQQQKNTIDAHHRLQQHHIQQCNMNLLHATVVKSELKTEDSDNKSQYEENVVQPPTPPESYGANDDKLLETLEKDNGISNNNNNSDNINSTTTTTATIPLEEDIEEAIDKLQATNNNNNVAKNNSNSNSNSNSNNNISTIEAYDLTTTTPPLQHSTIISSSSSSSNNNNTTNSSTAAAQQMPVMGRKARIGKTMAREMVYAGAAAAGVATSTTAAAATTTTTATASAVVAPALIQVRNALQHQSNSGNNSFATMLQQQPIQTPQVPLTSLASQNNVAGIIAADNLLTLTGCATAQQPLMSPPVAFILKAEIKTEKIKIEDDILDNMLQQHVVLQHNSQLTQQQQQQQQQQQHIIDKSELKVIKAEPFTPGTGDMLPTEAPDCQQLTRIMSSSGIFDLEQQRQQTLQQNTCSFPVARSSTGRMRLLPQLSYQKPPTINCDIDLSNTSDDDVLDLCHSPCSTSNAGGSSMHKRIKILEFHKNQCKKSPPNSYKNLIKQAEPRTYLCLSRKFDKRSRYGKLQGKFGGKAGSAGSGNVRRRQLILTEQQKKCLRMRKKKLQALERRKQEARDKKRAAAKQRRLEERQLKEQARRQLEQYEAASLIKQEIVEELAKESDIIDLVEQRAETLKQTPQPEVPTTTTTASPKHQRRAVENTLVKASPKRAKPATTAKKISAVPLHLVETIDAVARGYFSEPETRYSNTLSIFANTNSGGSGNVNSNYTESTNTNAIKVTETERKQKKMKMSSAEKRSKSETKKPIKTTSSPSASTLATTKIGSKLNVNESGSSSEYVQPCANAKTKTTSIQLEEHNLTAGRVAVNDGCDASNNQAEINENETQVAAMVTAKRSKKTPSKRKTTATTKQRSRKETKSKKIIATTIATATTALNTTTTTNKKANATAAKKTTKSKTIAKHAVPEKAIEIEAQQQQHEVVALVSATTTTAATTIATEQNSLLLAETNNNEYTTKIANSNELSTHAEKIAVKTLAEQAHENALTKDDDDIVIVQLQQQQQQQSHVTATNKQQTPPPQQQQQQSQHSDAQMFLQPALPVPVHSPQPPTQTAQTSVSSSSIPTMPPQQRIVCQHHHVTKRTRSRSKFGCRKRQKLKHSTVSFEVDDTLPPATRGDVVPKWNNGWTWEGESFQGAVFLNSDDPLVIRTCYPAMRHAEGDIIRTRDCVLLKANEDNELPYVAKVAHLWENPEDGEMMMSLLWYYRPEHTEQGRQHNDSPDEVYASRHRDHNSVACIEDKCYVLTFSEYCRYRRRLRAAEEDIEDVTIVPKRPNCYSIRTVPDNTNPELVMFCRRAYEFRTKRLLKKPNKQDYYVVTS